MPMSDHQDSEHFMGVRSEDEILTMLDRAEKKMNHHLYYIQKTNELLPKGNKRSTRKMYHMRNYKALEGVVKTLRWSLGDKEIEHPLE